MIFYIFFQFTISCIVGLLLIYRTKTSAGAGNRSVQDIHVGDISRQGGLAIFVAVFGSSIVLKFMDILSLDELLFISLATPVFLIGYFEDLYRCLSVTKRFTLLGLTTLFTCWIFYGWLGSSGSKFVDSLFVNFPLFTIFFTCFAIVGITNAFNIIDGLNGLSGGVALAILIGLLVLSSGSSDGFLSNELLILCASVAGFLVLNYPRANIFLGDGGAYLLGFLIAQISIHLSIRLPSVSPWCFFLMCIYPVSETIFSILRRLIGGDKCFAPDTKHLHTQLFYIIKNRQKFDDFSCWKANAGASVILVIFVSISVLCAVLLRDNTLLLLSTSVFFAIAYGIIWMITSWLSRKST